MAQHSLRAKKKARPVPPDKQPSMAVMVAGILLSGALVTGLAVIAPEIALLTLAIMALASFVFFDMRKRGFWEKSTTAKIRGLNESHERLSKEVERQRYDIMFIREELDEKVATKAVAQGAPAEAQRMPLDFDPIPKAVTPVQGLKKAISKKSLGVANQDSKANHAALSDTVVRELVHSAVRAKRIDVFVQPIMRLPQRKVRFYEVYARIRARPGMYLPASRYMELARQERLMNDIDHLLLMQCLKTIRDTATLDRAVPFFINITPSTLTNMTFMKQLLGFLSQNRGLAPRLVFEIRQADFTAMKPAILEILRGLGSLGCALSIDHVTTLNFDLKFLQVLKVRFVKVGAASLLAKTKSDRDFNEIERQKRKLEGNGIGFIVEKIENETTLRELLDFSINYGQGFLFGKPDLQGAYRQQAVDAG